MPNETALEERLEQLTEELITLKAAAETASTTSSSSTPSRKLENLDLDTHLTTDKKIAALDAWVVRAERIFRSRKLKDSRLTEAEFTDELCDYIGKSSVLKTHMTTLFRISMSTTLASVTARHHAAGQRRNLPDAFIDAKEEDDDADAATTASKEDLKSPPQTIAALYLIVLKLYRFKATGVDALKEFTDARQKGRTPSEYIAYLQELASKTLNDSRVEPLNEAQVFFKFRSTLWIDIQRGITSIKEKDILDGKTDRNLNDLDEFVRVAEFVHDQVKSEPAKKPTMKYSDKGVAPSLSTEATKEKKEKISVHNVLDKRTSTVSYVAVKYADLAAEKKEAIQLFQKQHKPPLRDAADKESAKRLGLCFKCVQYGHIASTCKVAQVNAVGAAELTKNASG